MWVYANVDAVELIVNGASQGVLNMTQFDHVEWDDIPWESGSVQAVGFVHGSSEPVVSMWRNTTGAPAGMRLSLQDNVGATLIAGCADIALVQVEIIDANGAVVPTADNVVTLAVTGAGTLAGTANGDPACQVNNLSPWRPAFAGLMSGVILTGDDAGLIKVQATSPGLPTQTMLLTVTSQPAALSEYWCKNGPRL